MNSRLRFILVGLLCIPSAKVLSQTDLLPMLELYLQQVSVRTSTVNHCATGLGNAMWDQLFNLTDSSAYWSPACVEVVDLDTSYGHGWDFVGNSELQMPILAAGLYSLTNSFSEDFVAYLDYRDDSLITDSGRGIDAVIRYDGANNVLRAQGTNPPTAWTTFSSGDTVKIWKLKRGSDAQPHTARFQPTDPTNLSVTNYNGNPRLTWTASEPASAKYKVYRGGACITSTPINDTYFVDYDYGVTGPDSIPYSVRAISGDGSKYSVNYSNTAKINAVCLLKPPGSLTSTNDASAAPEGVYPNPFNPETSIRFKLAVDSHVHLSVYDLLGRETVRLVDGDLRAGAHDAVWIGEDAQGRPVPSGMYLYRIESAGGTRQGKMLLVR